jgi:hypothetical protein
VPCTMVQNEAYGRPDGGELAPRSGTIKKIRLIAGGSGTFRRLQIAKVKRSTLFGSNEAKVVANGPKIYYQGGLNLNAPFAPATSTDGCGILIEAVIR